MKRRRPEVRKGHKIPVRAHRGTCGDTPFYWTHPDQLETRTQRYQIPSISSGCLLSKYNPFSCSFLTRSVIALETPTICALWARPFWGQKAWKPDRGIETTRLQ